ncbi:MULTISPECIES: ATP-binding protein [unclassified Pseudoalteromonas]|uniref:ATP-binding protein n=1 Tax=unclassified Pseudoalteromonas TaxID=194690 RepID=UPI001F3D7E8A|nr:MULTISPECIES: ATP-binding protein [unclassified Pseudoalteromonas]MCF2825798.1 ATP-binding protein [Pseudoalteromonas sp. OF5H-5]MCF2830833.1 ATP-binding protein [Pseudoalteromonas sp. DL2-H6]MCF2923642.1 ATP-binding protein [Pseudoalteromonas sp. DL2-H1]
MMDPKLLIQVTAITTVVCTVFMAVNWFINKGLPGTRDWLVFIALTAIGCGLLAAYTLPITFSIFIPNLTIALGLFYLARGVDAFFSVKSNYMPWYVLAALGIPSFTYFLYVEFNFIARVGINYLVWAMAMIYCLRALNKGHKLLSQQFSAAHWAFGLSCLSLLAVFTFRVVMLGGYSVTDSLVSANWVNQFFAVSVSTMPLLLCFSLCLLCSSRREKELCLLKTAAEQSAQVKGQFLTLLSHELRTPLNAIVGHAESLKKVPREPNRHAQLCDVIVHAAMSMSDLANQVLLQAKGEYAAQNRVPVSLYSLSQELVRLLQPLALAKGLSLRVEVKGLYPQDVHVVEQDTLSLVLRNLLSNAIKYTDKGIITLILEGTSRAEDKQTIRFAIKDTGKGLTEVQMEKIFEPFVTLNTEQSISQSSGFGLALCKQLLQGLDSELNVDSKLGNGTVFSFELDCQCSDSPLQSTEFNTEKLALNVLVVEDNLMNIDVISTYLNDMVSEFSIAKCLAEAEVALLEHNFDIILLDMRLPDGNGLEWFKEGFNEIGFTSSVKVIALTGDGDPELKRQCLRAGMQDCLTKPIMPSRLYAALECATVKTTSRLECKTLIDQSRFMDLANRESSGVLATKLMYLADRFEYEIAQIKGLTELNVTDLAIDKLAYIENEALELGMVNFAELVQAATVQLSYSEEQVDWDGLAMVARRSVERLLELHAQIATLESTSNSVVNLSA